MEGIFLPELRGNVGRWYRHRHKKKDIPFREVCPALIKMFDDSFCQVG